MVLHRQVFLVACYLQLQLTLNFTFVQHPVNCSIVVDLLYLHLQEELLPLWVSFSYVTILSYMNGVHTLTDFTFLPSKQPWEEGGLKNPIWNYMVHKYVSLHPYWLGYHIWKVYGQSVSNVLASWEHQWVELVGMKTGWSCFVFVFTKHMFVSNMVVVFKHNHLQNQQLF